MYSDGKSATPPPQPQTARLCPWAARARMAPKAATCVSGSTFREWKTICQFDKFGNELSAASKFLRKGGGHGLLDFSYRSRNCFSHVAGRCCPFQVYSNALGTRCVHISTYFRRSRDKHLAAPSDRPPARCYTQRTWEKPTLPSSPESFKIKDRTVSAVAACEAQYMQFFNVKY